MQAFGRSRGGFTSKVHARCDNQGLPIGFVLTGGEASDYTATDDLMVLPLPKPKALLPIRDMMATGFGKTCSCAAFCRSSHRARTARRLNILIIGAIGIATASSACSAN